MAANYNNSAWFYDKLSKVIYGKALVSAQVYLLPFIPPKGKILLIGGGTGWILEEIAKVHPSDLQITYVEVASKMIALARKKDPGGNKVEFINQAVEEVSFSKEFDAVVTPFLFDNFTEENLQKIFAHIHHNLKTRALWLNVDFRLTGKWWQKVLLKSMLLFFRLVCNIEATKLPDIHAAFEKYDYRTIEQKSFLGDFILSTLYRKI
ncbi:MAG TPA: class I SAM-dependent methyltransferase [Mucilaginibacter sp.]|jgi:ubiquinone/menaquinone biosynthesis C-methylase UbiE|nr:class I SAM-dependent methyltransferase [Mucilaginibacter sp.]